MGLINPIYNEISCWEADCHVHPKEKTVLGVLDITISLEQIDQTIKKATINSIILTLVIIIVLSLITGYVVKILVDRPVKELVSATQNVAAGNLSYAIDDLGTDELGTSLSGVKLINSKLEKSNPSISVF